MPPSAARASRTKPVAPSTVDDVGDDRHRAATDPRGRGVDRLAIGGRRSRPAHLRRRAPRATANPRPFDAAATAARFPQIPRSTTCLLASSVNRTRSVAQRRDLPAGAQAMISAQIAIGRLLRRAGADVEPDRRHHPRDLGVGEPARAAARRGPRACAANPSRRGSRRRSAPRPRSRARRTCGRASGRTPRRAVRARRRPWRGSGRASR